MPDVKPKAARKASPSWSDVKAKLTDFDRAGLIGMVQALYVASKDNQAFLHARFTLGGDVLKPYKVTIDRWLWLEGDLRVQEGQWPAGRDGGTDGVLLRAGVRLQRRHWLPGRRLFDALVRKFEQSLQMIATLPHTQRPALWTRLAQVQRNSDSLGYGVADNMDALLAEYGFDG